MNKIMVFWLILTIVILIAAYAFKIIPLLFIALILSVSGLFGSFLFLICEIGKIQYEH